MRGAIVIIDQGGRTRVEEFNHEGTLDSVSYEAQHVLAKAAFELGDTVKIVDLEKHALEEARWPTPLHVLTPAQRKALRGLICGLTNAQIATHVGCNVKTVKSYVTAIYKAAGCTNSREFLVWYFSHPRMPRTPQTIEEVAA